MFGEIGAADVWSVSIFAISGRGAGIGFVFGMGIG